jgi:hypothetical protein
MRMEMTSSKEIVTGSRPWDYIREFPNVNHRCAVDRGFVVLTVGS